MTRTYNEKPVLGITLGDAAGVGPEIVAKVIAKGVLETCCRPVIIGDERVLKMGMKVAKVDFPYTIIENIEETTGEGIWILDQKDVNPEEIRIGEVNPICGKAAGDALIMAVNLYKEGKIDGFCFASLNKAALKSGGHMFESEQMLFAQHFNWTEPFGEVNVLDNVWTTRVTSHIPVKEISNSLTIENVMRAIKLATKTLTRAGIQNPRLGIAALNPHGGENGLCGTEEIDVIIPAMEQARQEKINVLGPFPADILFIKAFDDQFDAAVTMYHDQGQIALKLRGFEFGITIAAGFPAPIVTPAHGTAYDIAGKGIANTGAFENAVKMAARIALCDKKVLVSQ
ncbi:4-hydroxythreonine-4-phosphate dehydrogenase PdxA [Pelosinus sp. UFO1]|uniref:4-hydroxythreonine-4-phosphate dehydrogenase PdxA n=1 Tax=Pelosinus sp. UFO1 TaxID=484770 RepID=UPI0004D191CC|nr:4-hydroxythreonine-4-phosphate dehydrogenase PdxA [Pelosinus sp. UFO1]AIF49655.1 4-hydroxythreonine-4-phosphate dehydrogenase [Pelosinus sp. UFO1]